MLIRTRKWLIFVILIQFRLFPSPSDDFVGDGLQRRTQTAPAGPRDATVVAATAVLVILATAVTATGSPILVTDPFALGTKG